MAFRCVSKFGKTNLIFVDPGVKINDTYYREVLLTDQLYCLSCVRWSLASSLSFSKTVLLSCTPSFGDNPPSGMEDNASISPDLSLTTIQNLNPIDYRILGEMQQTEIYDVRILTSKNWISLCFLAHGLEQSMINDAKWLVIFGMQANGLV